ncbi:MAG: multidrug effflux MFS transporter [Pelagimonas sp.]|jgi:DHA1 family bicyclomycin/chloramphenicol resistance-like MFS transporter|nr:multidrug effflux MFS transporter [Pelagimonas sp.]
MQTPASSVFLNRRTPPHVATLTLLAGLAALSMTIFVPSLSMMTAYFGTDYGIMQLSVAAYLGTNALLQVLIGPISDALGRRPVILWGIAIFCLATLGCLMTDNIWVFLAFRMLQAVIATALVLSRAAIRDMYDQESAASMIGYVTMGMSLVPMLGPVIGGYLGGTYGWQATYWLLFAGGVVLFAISYFDFKETLTITGKTLREQISEYPELLSSPRFWGFALSSAFASGAFFSYLGGAAYVSSDIYHLGPEMTGLLFGMPAVGYFAGNFLTGRFAARVGIIRMILWGCWAGVIGMGVLAILLLLRYDNALVFFLAMTSIGIGNGLTLPNATAGMLSVRPHLAGSASGLGGAINLAGGAALSAYAGVILSGASSPLPLVWLMLAVSVGALISIRLVILRERRLSGLDL